MHTSYSIQVLFKIKIEFVPLFMKIEVVVKMILKLLIHFVLAKAIRSQVHRSCV